MRSPGRPPTIAVTTAMLNDAYSPTLGSTPAMMENAIASGISAARDNSTRQNVSPDVGEPLLP